MERAILLIDGDNVTGNYAPAICEAANKFGKVCEAQMYSTFRIDKVNDKQGKPVPPRYTDKGWTAETLYKYGIVPNIIPILTAGTSTTDMAIMIHAVESVYKNPDIDVYIIATCDKDFLQLAMYLRNCGKKTVLLFRESDCKVRIAFNESERIYRSDEAKTEKALTVKPTARIAERTPAQYAPPAVRRTTKSVVAGANGSANGSAANGSAANGSAASARGGVGANGSANGSANSEKSDGERALMAEYRNAENMVAKYLEARCKAVGQCSLQTLGKYVKAKDIDLKKLTGKAKLQEQVTAMFYDFPAFSDKFILAKAPDKDTMYFRLK